MARRVTYVLLWLALVPEVEGRVFAGKWETPLTWLGTAIFNPSFVKVTFWDLAVLATLAWALLQKKARKGRTRPIATSMAVSLAAIASVWAWGVVRGGDVRQTMWQLHNFVMLFVVAHLVTATCRTYAHFRTLGRVIVGATLYRALLLLYFYELVVKSWAERPETLTTHADTALFVSGLLLLGVWAVERRSPRAIAWALGGAVPIALAIYFNNRRLAWLSLGVGALVGYLLLPRGRVKRRIDRMVLLAAPIALLYVAIGWNRRHGVFKPVASIATMFGHGEDASSATRDIENYNLIQTLKVDPLLGLGFGHPYQEVSVAYSIKQEFAQYRYVPHNSVLGLLAFSGLLGFAAIWQVFVVSTFFLARTYRAAESAVPRTAALVGVLGTIVFILQMWGDMGMVTLPADVLVGSCIAVAARLPALVEQDSQARDDEEDDEDVDRAEDAERRESAT